MSELIARRGAPEDIARPASGRRPLSASTRGARGARARDAGDRPAAASSREPEIVDLTAYMPRSRTRSTSWRSTARSHRRCAAPLRRARRARAARARAGDHALGGCSHAAGAALRDFAERFAAARAPARRPRARRIVAAAVAEHGYDAPPRRAARSPERRIANVRKLERLAREFEAARGATCAASPRRSRLGRLGQPHETEAPPPRGTGAIRADDDPHRKRPRVPRRLPRRPRPPARTPAAGAARPTAARVGLRLPTLERAPRRDARLRASWRGAARRGERRGSNGSSMSR